MLEKIKGLYDKVKVGYTAASLLRRDAQLSNEVGRDVHAEGLVRIVEGRPSFSDYCKENCPEYLDALEVGTKNLTAAEGKIPKPVLLGITAYELTHLF